MTNATKQPTLPEALKLAREKLNKLARLGNEPLLGNSIGNQLAQEALAALDSLQVREPVGDHIEDVRGMVLVYQIRPDCENWIDCTEKYYAEWKGDKRTLYDHAIPCAQCAELQQDLQTTADALAEYQQSHRNMEQAHANQYEILCKRTDEVIALRAAIERMRVAGGSAEFQKAFELAKDLLP